MVMSHVASDRKRRENRLRAGLCYKCGSNKHLSNIKVCSICQAKAKAYHRERYTPAHLRTQASKPRRTRVADVDPNQHYTLVRRIRYAFWNLGHKRAEVVEAFSSLASDKFVNGVIDYRIEAGL